jgi:signal transduction histidine kinase
MTNTIFTLSPNAKKSLLEMRLSNILPPKSVHPNISDDEMSLIIAEWVVRNDCYNDLEILMSPATSPLVKKISETYRNLFTNPKKALTDTEFILNYESHNLEPSLKSRITIWLMDLYFLNGHTEKGRVLLSSLKQTIVADPLFEVEAETIFALCSFFSGNLILAKHYHLSCKNKLANSPDSFLKTFNSSMALRVALQLCDGELFEDFANELHIANKEKKDDRYQLREVYYRAMLLEQISEPDAAKTHWNMANQLYDKTKMSWEKGQYLTLRGLAYFFNSDSENANITLDQAKMELQKAGLPGPYLAEVCLARYLGPLANPLSRSSNLLKVIHETNQAKLELQKLFETTPESYRELYNLGITFCDFILNGRKYQKEQFDGSLILSIICNYNGHKEIISKISDFRLINLFFEWLSKNILTPESGIIILHELTGIMPSYEDDKFVINFESDFFQNRPEIQNLLNFANYTIQLIKRSETVAKHEAIAKITTQVAHDIRSPLAALNMAISDLMGIPEHNRVLIRSATGRIQDIANDLLLKNRNMGTIDDSEHLSLELVSSFLSSIISEKRMQFRSELKIEIEFVCAPETYALFATFDQNIFKRVMSNLINNSIEAIEDKGLVQIELLSENEKIIIKIKDNGRGISSQTLKKLGHSLGETYGKTDGNGIGLYHAKKSIESWDGALLIESELGIGTTLIIQLPKKNTPSWFTSELKIKKNNYIVILDDDSTIHHIWDQRLTELNISNLNIHINHFSKVNDVLDWYEKNNKNENILYLFDFELAGEELTGLDLIEKMNIANQSILVTSRFEEKEILNKLQSLGVKLIPKNLAEIVPIKIESTPFHQLLGDSTYDAIYIDDDQLMQITWNYSAKKKNIKLLTLKSTQEFLEKINEISPTAPIYIDRELGVNEPHGEDFAKELSIIGFKNLFLTTGHPAENFSHLDFLNGVIGKSPPW